MYDYHNGLTVAAPGVVAVVGVAVRPQARVVLPGGFAGGTTAAIYDAGNLVIWWLGVPAMVFVCDQAYRRRSLALALIAIGFAASGCRGRGSTAPRSSTTTTRRCRS